MMSIWSYTLTHRTDIEMSCCAKILSVGIQDNELRINALIDPEAKTEARRFWVCPTGCDIPKEQAQQLEFIGSVQIQTGHMLHIFEENF